SFTRPRPPPALHSFPTRRSSDLGHPARVVLDLAGAGKHQPAPEPALRVPPVIIRETPLHGEAGRRGVHSPVLGVGDGAMRHTPIDRKSTRLNSSHVKISYAVFCL